MEVGGIARAARPQVTVKRSVCGGRCTVASSGCVAKGAVGSTKEVRYGG